MFIDGILCNIVVSAVGDSALTFKLLMYDDYRIFTYSK